MSTWTGRFNLRFKILVRHNDLSRYLIEYIT